MSGTAVFVSNVSPAATEKTVSDFFSFCGRIQELYLKPAPDADDGVQVAVVVFESNAAAKTALLLTNALIIDRAVTVAVYDEEGGEAAAAAAPAAEAAVATAAEGAASPATPAASPATPTKASLGAPAAAENVTERDFGGVPDEERSGTSVIASLMAAGYEVGEGALAKAAAFDQQHGFSQRAQAAVDAVGAKARELDDQYKVSEQAAAAAAAVQAKAKEVDEQYQISTKTQQVAQAASLTAQAAAAKAQENETVAGGVIRAKAGAAAVAGTVNSIYAQYQEETRRAIAERQAARAALEGAAPAAPDAAAAAPAAAVAPSGEPVEPLADDAAAAPVADISPESAAAAAAATAPAGGARPGGLKEEADPDDEVRSIADSVRSEVEAQSTAAGADLFAAYDVLAVARQVVAGTNFFIKIRVAEDGGCVHARVFKDLSGKLSVHSVQVGKTATDELEFF